MKTRVAAYVLVFGCDLTLIRMLRNIGRYVEKIYLAYSELPWRYNDKSRALYTNPTNLKILEESEYRNKVEVIEGRWDRDEDQRNACVDRARSDGIDILLCVDADEFYLESDLDQMLSDISAKPQYDAYRARYVTFWKNLESVVWGRHGMLDTGYGMFALRCNRGIRHTKMRDVSSGAVLELEQPCFHLGYVMGDTDMRRKLATWSHSADFDTEWWYRAKWLGWTLETRNIHPMYPPLWKRAVRYQGPLPQALREFKAPETHYVRPPLRILLGEILYDNKANLKWHVRPYWRRLRYGHNA